MSRSMLEYVRVPFHFNTIRSKCHRWIHHLLNTACLLMVLSYNYPSHRQVQDLAFHLDNFRSKYTIHHFFCIHFCNFYSVKATISSHLRSKYLVSSRSLSRCPYNHLDSLSTSKMDRHIHNHSNGHHSRREGRHHPTQGGKHLEVRCLVVRPIWYSMTNQRLHLFLLLLQLLNLLILPPTMLRCWRWMPLSFRWLRKGMLSVDKKISLFMF